MGIFKVVRLSLFLCLLLIAAVTISGCAVGDILSKIGGVFGKVFNSVKGIFGGGGGEKSSSSLASGGVKLPSVSAPPDATKPQENGKTETGKTAKVTKDIQTANIKPEPKPAKTNVRSGATDPGSEAPVTEKTISTPGTVEGRTRHPAKDLKESSVQTPPAEISLAEREKLLKQQREAVLDKKRAELLEER